MSEQIALFDVDEVSVACGYRAPVVLAVAEVTYRQLDYWARTGLVTPSVKAAEGSGSQRLYSFSDVVLVKIIKKLLSTGISLQSIRKAVEVLRDRGDDAEDLSRVTLVSDGVSIYECVTDDEVVDLLAGGQAVFGIAIKRTVEDVRGAVVAFPAEPGAEASDDARATAVVDELSARRAARAAS